MPFLHIHVRKRAGEPYTMRILKTGMEPVFMLEPDVHEDERGFFMESFNRRTWDEAGLSPIGAFVQENHSMSAEAGILRGLHYQLVPKAQSKLVRVTSGAILDVAVDLRSSSPTFGRWVGVILSAANKRQLFVPRGFAHGFCTLVPATEVQYKVDEYYSPKHERGILWNDPAVGIEWPASKPILSKKDAELPLLAHAEIDFG